MNTERVASWPSRVLSWPIQLYQAARAGRPSPCRYTPSCSSYALEALSVHGAARGLWLAVKRIARCHPWGGHGWDPVPLPHDNCSHHRGSSATERKVA